MSPLGIISALIALSLGAFGPRFWWKGLAMVAVSAVVVALVGIRAMQTSGYPLRLNLDLSPWMVAQILVTAIAYMLALYSIGFGAAWAVRRRKRS